MNWYLEQYIYNETQYLKNNRSVLTIVGHNKNVDI